MNAIGNRRDSYYPPTQNGKEKRPGLISKVDFLRLPRYNTGGTAILLPDDYASEVGAISANGSAHLRAQTVSAFVESPTASHLTSNAYYDGTNWQRYNIAAGGYVVVAAATGLLIYTFAAAANPIAFSADSPRTLVVGTLWANAAFAANWGNTGGGNPTVQYAVNAEGWIVLKGLATKGIALALPDTIFTLPAGFRPTTTQSFETNSSTGRAEIIVTPAGLVRIQAGGGAPYTAVTCRFDPAT